MKVTDADCFLASDYPATKHQVSKARRWAREAVNGLVDDETAYDLSLCAGEMSDNARKHGRADGVISVALYLTEADIRLVVTNDGSGSTVPHVTDNLVTEEGHGLKIVAAVAAEWGAYATADHKQVVWCQFPRK